MAIGDDAPSVEEFDRADLSLSPEMHQVQAEMAAERGEGYDPVEFERRIREQVERMPDPLDDVEPVR